jgi:hypothetical protein
MKGKKRRGAPLPMKQDGRAWEAPPPQSVALTPRLKRSLGEKNASPRRCARSGA